MLKINKTRLVMFTLPPSGNMVISINALHTTMAMTKFNMNFNFNISYKLFPMLVAADAGNMQHSHYTVESTQHSDL